MHKLFRKGQVLTIPNLLSLVRILLIPLIVWLYCFRQKYHLAAVVILLSGATDIIDGFIARRFNMVSDIGKALDPIADKLTQFSIILCLTVKYPLMMALVIFFVIKEIIMLILGLIVMNKKGEVNGAKWHGKANTVIIYSVMMVLILFPQIPLFWANCMVVLCGCSMLFSLISYIVFYIERLKYGKMAS